MANSGIPMMQHKVKDEKYFIVRSQNTQTGSRHGLTIFKLVASQLPNREDIS